MINLLIIIQKNISYINFYHFRRSYMKRKLVLASLFAIPVLVFSILYYAHSQDAKTEPQPRAIPGITVDDQFPHSCVSCHKNYTEQKMDVRLSSIIKAWSEKIPEDMLAKYQASAPEGITLKGKHPSTIDGQSSIPEACNKCHGKSMKTALPFSRLMHLIHLSGGKQNLFLSMFGGECTHCHKLDQKTGAWTIVNGKEADEK